MIQKLSIAVDSISYNDGSSGKVELLGNRIVSFLPIAYPDEFRQRGLKKSSTVCILTALFNMSVNSPSPYILRQRDIRVESRRQIFVFKRFFHLLEISVLFQILEECIKDLLEELRSPVSVLATDIGFGGGA